MMLNMSSAKWLVFLLGPQCVKPDWNFTCQIPINWCYLMKAMFSCHCELIRLINMSLWINSLWPTFGCMYHGTGLKSDYHWFRLTLNVPGLSYLGLTRSISWLLMPWLLTLAEHQQPRYWLFRSLSYLRNDFKYLCHINVEEWHKI